MSSILTRWEHLRDLTRGPKQYLKAVAEYLKTHPAVIYHGDSWFSTPLYPNLARQSAARVDGLRMVVGKPGALAAELFGAKAAAQFAARIKSLPFDLVCLSAGGNDLLGARLKSLFRTFHAQPLPRITAADAFDRVLASGAFTRLNERYRSMLDALLPLDIPKRPLRVVGHTYVPLRQIGQKGQLTLGNIGLIAILKGDVGPWLYGPMDRVLKDPAEGKLFADLLLVQGFKQTVLVPLEAQYAGFFRVADLAQAQLDGADDWYDEIHPTEAGFAKCTAVLNAQIRQALPADKAGSVGS